MSHKSVVEKYKIVTNAKMCRYGHSGIITRKVDVYAFGVVLYELISAKEAIVKEDGVDEALSLVALVTFFFKFVYIILLNPQLGNFPVVIVILLCI